MVDDSLGREKGGIVHHFHIPICPDNFVDDVGRGCYQGKVIFPFQTLLDDIHMKESQKAAAETKPQGGGSFRLKHEGSVVELQFFQGIAEIVIIGVFHRIKAAVHHGGSLAITRQGLGSGMIFIRNGIPHPRIADVLDGRGKETDHAFPQFLDIDEGRFEDTHFRDFIDLPCCHETNGHALFKAAIDHTQVEHDPFIRVKFGVKDERLQRSCIVPLGGRNAVNDSL